MSEQHNLLTTKEAAAYLRLSHRTLERYRVTGEGPTFVKARRRVFYRQADLDQWLENSRRRSTSDPGPEPDREATLGSEGDARGGSRRSDWTGTCGACVCISTGARRARTRVSSPTRTSRPGGATPRRWWRCFAGGCARGPVRRRGTDRGASPGTR